jgi:hypothetical protein
LKKRINVTTPPLFLVIGVLFLAQEGVCMKINGHLNIPAIHIAGEDLDGSSEYWWPGQAIAIYGYGVEVQTSCGKTTLYGRVVEAHDGDGIFVVGENGKVIPFRYSGAYNAFGAFAIPAKAAVIEEFTSSLYINGYTVEGNDWEIARYEEVKNLLYFTAKGSREIPSSLQATRLQKWMSQEKEEGLYHLKPTIKAQVRWALDCILLFWDTIAKKHSMGDTASMVVEKEALVITVEGDDLYVKYRIEKGGSEWAEWDSATASGDVVVKEGDIEPNDNFVEVED